METNRPALIAFRIKSGYSQREFAKRLGVAHTTIMRIEKGDRNASPKLGKKIADLLGIPMEAIFFIHVGAEWNNEIPDGKVDKSADVNA